MCLLNTSFSKADIFRCLVVPFMDVVGWLRSRTPPAIRATPRDRSGSGWGGCMPEALGLGCHPWGPWEEQGCFPQPQLLLESECSQCKGLDFVEVDTILEKAFTCHMHENLTGFSLSPAWNKSTDVTSFKFLYLAMKLAGIGSSVWVAGKGKVQSSCSLRRDWVNLPWGPQGSLGSKTHRALLVWLVAARDLWAKSRTAIPSSAVQALWDKGWCCFPWTLARRVEPSVGSELSIKCWWPACRTYLWIWGD